MIDQHDYDKQEADGLIRELELAHDDRMREGGTPTRVNDCTRLLKILVALGQFPADDARSIETKLGQICGEWTAHRIDRDTPINGFDLPLPIEDESA